MGQVIQRKGYRKPKDMAVCRKRQAAMFLWQDRCLYDNIWSEAPIGLKCGSVGFEENPKEKQPMELGMVVTTHSDIILQHINNMVCLAGREDAETICRKLGYTEDDLLNAKDVKVYQFTSQHGGKTKVEELACRKNGFAVPTFNEALDRIMEEAYIIQE